MRVIGGELIYFFEGGGGGKTVAVQLEQAWGQQRKAKQKHSRR